MLKEDSFSWEKFVSFYKQRDRAKWEEDDPNKEKTNKKRKINPKDNRLDHDYKEFPE